MDTGLAAHNHLPTMTTISHLFLIGTLLSVAGLIIAAFVPSKYDGRDFDEISNWERKDMGREFGFNLFVCALVTLVISSVGLVTSLIASWIP